MVIDELIRNGKLMKKHEKLMNSHINDILYTFFFSLVENAKAAILTSILKN